MNPTHPAHFADAQQRDQAVAEIHDLTERIQKAYDTGDFASATSLTARRLEAVADYFRRLPLRSLSCCPFCQVPLVWRIDLWGVESEWWRPDCVREHPLPCRHSCTLRGAVNYHGKPPRGAARFEARTGPEIPYVIPRMLRFDGMVAVIASLKVPFGDLYTIGYYAERRPPVQDLVANWPNKTYSYTSAMGRVGYKFDTDPWDFNLDTWIQQNKVLWCPPEKPDGAPVRGTPQDCPYRNLPGQREMMVVNANGVFGGGVPDGSFISPYED